MDCRGWMESLPGGVHSASQRSSRRAKLPATLYLHEPCRIRAALSCPFPLDAHAGRMRFRLDRCRTRTGLTRGGRHPPFGSNPRGEARRNRRPPYLPSPRPSAAHSAGISRTSPAPTTISRSSNTNFSAPEIIHEYCSFTWEWRGTTAPRFSRSCEIVAFSPEIIWREIISFSFSTSIVFHEVFSRALTDASSSVDPTAAASSTETASGVNPVL